MARMKGGENKMRYEDYDDLEMVEGKHQKEVVDVVREALRAREVVVCDYVVYISFFILYPVRFSWVALVGGKWLTMELREGRSEDAIQTGR